MPGKAGRASGSGAVIRFFLIVAAVMLFWLALVKIAAGDDKRFLRNPAGCGDFCPPPVAIAQQWWLEETGAWPFCYHQETNASIRTAVLQGLTEWQEHTGVFYYEDCSLNDYEHIATAGNAFVYGTGSRPGCGLSATACLPQYTAKVRIVYDAASMQPWPLRSQIAVVLHEECHAEADCGEYYRHTGGQLACTGKPWSIMDCGLGHALTVQPFDVQTFRSFHYPPFLAHYGFGRHADGTAYVFFCDTDRRAHRVALLYDHGQGAYWSGYYRPVSPVGCAGALVECAPGRTIGIKQESALSWQRALTEVWVGCW